MDLTFAVVFPIVAAVVLTVGGLALGIVVRRWVVPRLVRSAQATRAGVDDVLVAALLGPLVLWFTMLGAYLASQFVALPGNAAFVLRRLLVALLIISVTWSASRVAYMAVESRTRILGKPPVVNLISNLVRLVILILGGLIVLQDLGISITPLITALGVGGLAVGLALQDTLDNLFAGIHILAARQIRRGDFVHIETGEEGYVQDVTWRYTTVRQLSNNLTVVPNSKLASAIVTNFSLPSPELAVVVDVCVSYDSDLRQVETMTLEVARDVMRSVAGAVPDFEPFIRFGQFADRGIVLSVIMRGREVTDQYLIRHEFMKRLHHRYRAEGIDLPRVGMALPARGLEAPPRARTLPRNR